MTLLPGARSVTPARHDRMPYRVFLAQIGERLRHTYDGRPNGYADAAAVPRGRAAHRREPARQQGRERRAVLRSAPAARASTRSASTSRRSTCASTPSVHHQVLARGLDDPQWLDALERRAPRAARRCARARRRPARRARRARQAHARRVRSDRAGPAPLRRRAPSATSSSAARRARTTCSPPLLLARWAEAYDKRTGEIALDVAPLFESVDTLERCGDVMRDAARRAGLPPPPRSARPPPVRADRLLGQQQGRWPRAPRASRPTRRSARWRRRSPRRTREHRRSSTRAAAASRAAAAASMRWCSAAPVEALNGVLRLTEQGEAISRATACGPSPCARWSAPSTRSARTTAARSARQDRRRTARSISKCARDHRRREPRGVSQARARGPRVLRLLPRRHADRRDRAHADRLAARASREPRDRSIRCAPCRGCSRGRSRATCCRAGSAPAPALQAAIEQARRRARSRRATRTGSSCAI